jgi:peptidoglycan/LPS O-acetylase OafA/YrhL
MNTRKDGNQKKDELYGIQMLRALAALAVVTHHSLEQSNAAAGRFSPDWLTTFGAAGVDVFFVISGFIMLYVSFPAGDPPITSRSFLFGRTTRIFPLYWLCCLGIIVISMAGFLQHHHWTGNDLVKSFFLFPSENPVVHVSWTLVYEMYFYFIFAAVLMFRSANLAALGAAAVIFGVWFGNGLVPLKSIRGFLADPIPMEFCMGLLLALAFSVWKLRTKPWPISISVSLIGLGFLLAASYFLGDGNTSGLGGARRVLAWGLPATLVVAAFLQVRPPQNRLGRALVLVGDASYSLYLTHVFVMLGYGYLLNGQLARYNQAFVVLVVVTISLGTALLVHLLVERPIDRLIRPRRRSFPRSSGFQKPQTV